MNNLKNAPVVFVDADDTLWENEQYFRNAEDEFARILAPYANVDGVREMLWRKQEENIPYFGYGSKTYFIAMADAATGLCGGNLPYDVFQSVRHLIIDLAFHPFEIIDGVEETLKSLSSRHKLVIATKGETMEQLHKIKTSGLEKYFFSSEVMVTKSEEDYADMARKYGVKPCDIIMIGNSSRSDILPVVNLGGVGIMVPHEIVWSHEIVELPETDRIIRVGSFKEISAIL